MLSFDHKTHARLMKESSILAKQYRIDCWLEKPEVKQEDVIQENIETQDVWQEVIEESPEKKDYSREDLKEMLITSDIKFFNNAKTDKLLKLCIENKLI